MPDSPSAEDFEEFCDVVHSRDYEAVESRLRESPDYATHVDPAVGSALHFANEPRIAELLIAHGANVNARDSGGETPLFVAAHWNDTEWIRVLLDHGAEIEAKDERGNTPVFEAATSRENATQAARYLLERGAHVDLETAAVMGDFARAKELLLASPDLARTSRLAHDLIDLAVLEAYVRFQCSEIEGNQRPAEDFAEDVAPLLRLLVDHGGEVPAQGESMIEGISSPAPERVRPFVELLDALRSPGRH